MMQRNGGHVDVSLYFLAAMLVPADPVWVYRFHVSIR